MKNYGRCAQNLKKILGMGHTEITEITDYLLGRSTSSKSEENLIKNLRILCHTDLTDRTDYLLGRSASLKS